MNEKKAKKALDKKVELSEIIKTLSLAFHTSNIAEVVEEIEACETLTQKLEAVEKLSFVNAAVTILKSHGLNEKEAGDIFVSFTEIAEEKINKRR